MKTPEEVIDEQIDRRISAAEMVRIDIIEALDAAGWAIHPLSEIRELDAVVHALGIEDSHTTPAEAVEELKSEIEKLRAMTAKEKPADPKTGGLFP